MRKVTVKCLWKINHDLCYINQVSFIIVNNNNNNNNNNNIIIIIIINIFFGEKYKEKNKVLLLSDIPLWQNAGLRILQSALHSNGSVLLLRD